MYPSVLSFLRIDLFIRFCCVTSYNIVKFSPNFLCWVVAAINGMFSLALSWDTFKAGRHFFLLWSSVCLVCFHSEPVVLNMQDKDNTLLFTAALWELQLSNKFLSISYRLLLMYGVSS